MTYDFKTQLTVAGNKAGADMRILAAMMPGAIQIRRGTLNEDKSGGDYIVKMSDGRELYVDAKTRAPNCSRFWQQGPEIALELWSVMEGGKYRIPAFNARLGWTLDESKKTDFVLFTFDPQDCNKVYLVPFDELKVAFNDNKSQWLTKYKSAIQDSGEWESQSLFVPIEIVIEAICRNKGDAYDNIVCLHNNN